MHGHKIINQNALHYITFTVVGWVDIFSRYEELKSKYVDEDFEDQFMCCLIIWIIILVAISIVLEGEYNIFSNLMKFLTKKRTIKT